MYLLHVKEHKGIGRELAKKFGGRQVEGGTLRDVYEFDDYDSLYAATDEISQKGLTLESYDNEKRVYAPWNACWDAADIFWELDDPDDIMMALSVLLGMFKILYKKEYQEEILESVLEYALEAEDPTENEEN